MRIGDLVEAVVSSVGADGAVVRWESGEGWLPRGEALGELRQGQRLLLKVVSVDPRGRPILSQRGVGVAGAEGPGRYPRERRLLTREGSAASGDPPVEERLSRWIAEAERGLERLRRRRARFGLRG